MICTELKGKKINPEEYFKCSHFFSGSKCLSLGGGDFWVVVMWERGGINYQSECHVFLHTKWKQSITCPLSTMHILADMCMFYTDFS